MGSAKNSPRCLPINPEICSHSYFLLSVPLWNSSRGVGSLPFLYWITVVYMNYTRPYGNLLQFVRGKTSSLTAQSKEIKIRQSYRYRALTFLHPHRPVPKFCPLIEVTFCFPNSSGQQDTCHIHTHIHTFTFTADITDIYSTLQVFSPLYTKLASCLHATWSNWRKTED